MLRFLKYSWIVLVAGGGAAIAIMALLSHDPAGAALMGGIAVLALLTSFLFDTGDSSRKRSKGFEPHRRR